MLFSTSAAFDDIPVIDEVVIYNRSLSDAEISQVRKNGPTAVSSKGTLATTWASVKDQ